MAQLSKKLDLWMTNLPENLKNISIIYLAIPGSHDSMSYGIKLHAPVAPDAANAVHIFNKFVPCIVKRWAVTQKYCVTQQLLHGIRYLDLRFSLQPSDLKLYFVHGLYCEEIINPLRSIREFLDTNPGEFVILDCQHFYNFDQKDHHKLNNILRHIFGTKIYSPKDGTLNNCTLNNMASQMKQIIIVYRNPNGRSDLCWANSDWPNPWPNQIKVSKLEKYLDGSIQRRPWESGYVMQCVLTPTVSYIVPRFLSSIRRACAFTVAKNLFKWISEQTPGTYAIDGQPKANVFLADFIDVEDNEFCKLVIELNNKIV